MSTRAAVASQDIYSRTELVKLVIMFARLVKELGRSVLHALMGLYSRPKPVSRAAKLIVLVVTILARNVKMDITH